MNKDNLQILATYLKGPLEASFHMDRFDDGRGPMFGRSDCGTVGCAVGHGPYAGLPKEFEQWDEYCERVFGLVYFDQTHMWCFSGEWWTVDNTAIGASLRIDYMLKHGVPDEFDEPSRDWVRIYSGHDD